MPNVIFLVTSLHTGYVGFTVDVLNEPPALDDAWEEIVEASFAYEGEELTACTCMCGATFTLPPTPGTSRVRYCGRGMDAAHASTVVFDDERSLAPTR